jgi:hypothetical protein
MQDGFVVNILADFGAIFVVLLPGHIDAVLGATLFEQIFLFIVVKEDVQVALDFLCGGPINLAIPLQALNVFHLRIVDRTALFIALREIIGTDPFLFHALRAHARLELLLDAIALDVCKEELAIGVGACPMLDAPLIMSCFKLGDRRTQPSSISLLRVREAFVIKRFANKFASVLRLLAIGWLRRHLTNMTVEKVLADAVFCCAVNGRSRCTVKITTFLCHVLVQSVDTPTAFNMMIVDQTALSNFGFTSPAAGCIIAAALAETLLGAAIVSLLVDLVLVDE